MPNSVLTHGRRTAVLALVVCILVVATALARITFSSSSDDPGHWFTPDSQHYFTMGYNLYAHGVLDGWTGTNDAPRAPSAYREPGMPVVVAALLKLKTDEIPGGIECILNGGPECDGIVLFLVYTQIFFILLICVLIIWLTWQFTHRPFISVLPAIILSSFLIAFPRRSWAMAGYVEPLAMFLFTLTSALLAFSAVRGKPVMQFVTGISLALLALTKAIFALLVWPAAILLGLVVWKGASKRLDEGGGAKQGLLAVILFALGFYLTAGPWMLRNYQELGFWGMSHRGESILSLRAQYDQMTLPEYLTAFVFWTPGGPSVAERFLPQHYYSNLVRSNPEGYLQRTVAKLGDCVSEVEKCVIDPESKTRLKRKAIQDIVSHPFKHLAVSLPVAYRSLFFMSFIGPLAFLSILWLAWRWLRCRSWQSLMFLLPSAYCFGMYALFTHGIPRYNMPLAAIGSVAIALAIAALSKKSSKWQTDTSIPRRVDGGKIPVFPPGDV